MKYSFSLRPGNAEEIIRALRRRADSLVATAGDGLYQCAADATPVRSGRARANWRCSIGAPQYTSDETTGLDANRAQEAFRDSAAGDVLYVTNSVPYIGQLEAGSSVQAPSGIAGSAIAACTANIESGAYLP